MQTKVDGWKHNDSISRDVHNRFGICILLKIYPLNYITSFIRLFYFHIAGSKSTTKVGILLFFCGFMWEVWDTANCVFDFPSWNTYLRCRSGRMQILNNYPKKFIFMSLVRTKVSRHNFYQIFYNPLVCAKTGGLYFQTFESQLVDIIVNSDYID